MVDKENSLKDPIKKDGDGNDFSLDSWEQYFDKTFLLHISYFKRLQHLRGSLGKLSFLVLFVFRLTRNRVTFLLSD